MSAAEAAVTFLADLDERPVEAGAPADTLHARLGGRVPEEGRPAGEVIERLIAGVDGGLVASGSPRFFGFVIGGAMPVAVAADWLTSAWDQNAQVFATSPAAAVVEEIVESWVLDLLGLPPSGSVGFVTGGQMATFTALVVARDAVLARAGWDVAARGLAGSPPLRVLVGEQAHGTVGAALAFAGIGTDAVSAIPTDGQGRLDPTALGALLRHESGPTIVCAQAGNVNSGAFDAFDEIADLTTAHRAWLHVDGAFGLWAAASPRYRHLTAGVDRADSWTIDAHKWLNVPYDSGMVVIRDAERHQLLKRSRCAYAGEAVPGHRDGSAWAPENSRRARAFVLYAAIASLGRSGVADLVDGCCDAAAHVARRAAELPGCRVLNDVVLNQVLLRFTPPAGVDPAAHHEQLAEALRGSGTCWLATTRWQGEPALRVSVSNWSTTLADVDRTVEVLRGAVSAAGGGQPRASHASTPSSRRATP